MNVGFYHNVISKSAIRKAKKRKLIFVSTFRWAALLPENTFPQFSVFQTAAWEFPYLPRVTEVRCSHRIRAAMFTDCEVWSVTRFKDIKLLIITKRSISSFALRDKSTD